MTEKNSGWNLIVAVIIAIIVGVVVYFLIDSKPVGETEIPATIGAVNDTGSVVTSAGSGG